MYRSLTVLLLAVSAFFSFFPSRLYRVLTAAELASTRGANNNYWQNGFADCSEFQNLSGGVVPESLCLDPVFTGSQCAKCQLDPITHGMAPFQASNRKQQPGNPPTHNCSGVLSFGRCVKPPDGDGFCVVEAVTPDDCTGQLDMWENQPQQPPPDDQ
jgi:hypothetical protein